MIDVPATINLFLTQRIDILWIRCSCGELVSILPFWGAFSFLRVAMRILHKVLEV